jgi:hypothetical protein
MLFGLKHEQMRVQPATAAQARPFMQLTAKITWINNMSELLYATMLNVE